MKSTLKANVAFWQSAIEYNLQIIGMKTRDEEGAVSTETALITAGLITLGFAVAGTLIAKANLFADCVPDPNGTVVGTC